MHASRTPLVRRCFAKLHGAARVRGGVAAVAVACGPVIGPNPFGDEPKRAPSDGHVAHDGNVLSSLPSGDSEAFEDDGALVATTLAGTHEAFGTLVERYDRAVYTLCLRTMRDREEARDCTQEAFFKAFRSLRTFKPGSRFSTWIFSIAYHACCDRLGRRKRFSSDELPDEADPGPGPETLAERDDEARALRAAIAALPEKYRTVITLYHLQNRQYDEIARVLDLPIGTVKTHLFRAKELLRKALVNR